jgi:hypothetical protein
MLTAAERRRGRIRCRYRDGQVKPVSYFRPQGVGRAVSNGEVRKDGS